MEVKTWAVLIAEAQVWAIAMARASVLAQGEEEVVAEVVVVVVVAPEPGFLWVLLQLLAIQNLLFLYLMALVLYEAVTPTSVLFLPPMKMMRKMKGLVLILDLLLLVVVVVSLSLVDVAGLLLDCS